MSEETESARHGPAEGGKGIVPQRSPRATSEEMNRRVELAAAHVAERGRVDAYEIAEATGLTHPQALTLIHRMLREGRLEKAGRLDRRQMYRVPRSDMGAPLADQPLPLADLVKVFAPGRTFTVAEVRLTQEQPLIELTDESGFSQTVALTS